MAFIPRNTDPVSSTQWGGQSINGAAAALHAEAAANRFLSGVYGWMAGGVGITALCAFLLVSTGTLEAMLLNFGRVAFYGIMAVQIGLVLALSFLAERLSVGATRAMFVLYSAATGVTIAMVSQVFTAASVASIFGVAASAFVGLALFGTLTKKNLGVMGTFLVMGLWMLIGLSVVNIFVGSAMLGYVGDWMGVLVFSGLTAWESQKLRQMAHSIGGQGELAQKYMVQGALTMYLNFINLFLRLLSLFGTRRD